VDNKGVADSTRAVILFDGVCHLCNGFVQFVLHRDSAGRFDFAPLQSKFGQEKLGGRSWDSVVLLEGRQHYEAETAVLRILRGLDSPWPLAASLLGCLPKWLLHWGYRTIARYRYTLFGRNDVCILPRPEWKSRFLA
jgi:predicted DCC family thiol-disulfide oxidoreductase YuxK